MKGTFGFIIGLTLLTQPLFVLAQEATEPILLDVEAPQEIIVRYKDNPHVEIITASSPEAVADIIKEVESDPSVEYAEPNYSRSIFVLPTDDHYGSEQWALDNTNDADMDIPEAWAVATGTDITVAVLDVGVDYIHPDIANMMWDGSGCVDENGASLGGCIHGYDFGSGDNDPMMPLSLPEDFLNVSYHGTHVAGIIGAESDNSIGIAGIAPHAMIMALKFDLDIASEVKAIDFARENGVKIINASYGGTGYSQEEYDAIKRFTDAGGLLIAAAGNDASDNESSPIYPASYDLPGIIAVAATDQDDNLASFSNRGSASIDVGAPGKNIISLYSTSTDTGVTRGYAFADGTSMATPAVTGLVALLWGARPELTASQIKQIILETGDSLSSLSGKTFSGKRVNAYAALTADIDPPTAVLSGLPDATSTEAIPSLSVSVSGTRVTDYRYKLDEEDWSDSEPISTPIERIGLLNGSHTLKVIGQSSLGGWQSEASSTDYSWVVLDETAPTITGLSNDTSGAESKTWSWASADPTATFRFEISATSTPADIASSTYSNTPSASASEPKGAVYIHIQAKDNNGNESEVATFSALLVEPAPVPVSSGGGGGGGGGGSSSGNPAPIAVVAKIGDSNDDGKVDLLDFNSLMIHWSEHVNPLGDFNSIMVHWAP